MRAKRVLVSVVIGCLLGGCAATAVKMAPKKQPVVARSEAAIKADALFWDTLHDGEYEKIPYVLEVLTAAYLETPGDPVTAAHVGWLHSWRIAERARLERVPPTITDDAVLERKYFQEAVALDPKDARYLGFLGSSVVIEGAIHQDERLVRQGYYLLRDSIEAWPEFNLFTAGYTMSMRPADTPAFREGLDWQWRTLDTCIQGRLDRENPDYSGYMALQTSTGKKRVCWNSWIAPHNFEGFFLNMGDMLVKAGDWQTARKIYANARLSADYASWKFRPVLEDRIRDAEKNVATFSADAPKNATAKAGRQIMVNSTFACVVCHQH